MEYMASAHEKLHAWQSANKLVEEIYALTDEFPPSEGYGFISQIRRAALSVPSNITEGYHRNTRKQYRYFCNVAYASANELNIQLNLAKKLLFLPPDHFTEAEKLMKQTLRLLYGLCLSLK